MILALLLLAHITTMASLEKASRPTLIVAKCMQPAAEREPLIREAITNQFWVRRVEFVGNESTRDYVVRRRVFLQEGDVFTRRNLARSVANLGKSRRLYPVKMNDVIVHLDRPNKLIDVAFCLRERH
jgi:hypothetical protein